ncbi:MAG: amino acid ABC transporter permease [Azospirillum sp.]|nr:amino acid ABC transporter permease [Azospirillum sp.]MCA3266266.1 amino acid ABC transporter permease [Azospirillum sp.]
MARAALACAGAVSLSGCGGHSYNWGWYVVSPLDPRGLKNLAFLADGLIATITISVAAIVLSVVVGALLAMAGMAQARAWRWLNRVYVEVFRAVPVLVLLLWVYYGLPVVAGIQFSVMIAGIATLAISDAAFEAEIFRAGIQSVPVGQSEAAKSLGLTRWQTMRLIVLPQAIRKILPALGNQFVYVLKMSSLVSVVGYQELTRRAQELVLIEYRPLEIYTMLVLEYLLLILVVSWLVRRLEARMAQGR